MIEIKQIIFAIALLTIILLGLIGNVVNLFVFSHKTIKNNSTFRYLFCLALIDILVLLTYATDSIHYFEYSISSRIFSILACKIHTFLTYLLAHLSSFVLMVVSIDRAIIICHKSQIKNDSDRHNSLNVSYKRLLFLNIKDRICGLFGKVRIVLFSLILTLFGLNLHFLFLLTVNKIDHQRLNETDFNENKFNDLKKYNNSYLIYEKSIDISNNSEYLSICYPLKVEIYFEFLSSIWIWIDAFIYSIIPFVVMSICSIIIIVDTRTKSKGFIKSCQTVNTNRLNHRICEKSKRRNQKLSIMLLVNNLFFIFCSLPFRFNMIYYNQNSEKDDRSSFQAYSHALAYLNNSFTFIFYYIFSTQYRKLISLLFSKQSEMNKNTAAVKSTTYPKSKSHLKTPQNSIMNENVIMNLQNI